MRDLIRRASAQGVSDHKLCALDIAFLEKNAMQTNSDSIFEHKTQARTAFFGTCARAIVSCLRSTHARGAVRGAWETAIHGKFHLGGHFFLTVSSASYFHQNSMSLTELVIEMEPEGDCLKSSFHKSSETREVRFDCTGACGLHVSPRHGAPQAARYYVTKRVDSKNLVCPRNIRNLTNNYTKKVSK